MNELSTTRLAHLYAGMSKQVMVTGLLLSAWVAPAWAAWSPGDRVVDYGVSLADGEREVIVDAEAMGNKFEADLLWQVDPLTCSAQALIATDRNRAAEWADLQDDAAFDGHPAHAHITMAAGGRREQQRAQAGSAKSARRSGSDDLDHARPEYPGRLGRRALRYSARRSCCCERRHLRSG